MDLLAGISGRKGVGTVAAADGVAVVGEEEVGYSQTHKWAQLRDNKRRCMRPRQEGQGRLRYKKPRILRRKLFDR